MALSIADQIALDDALVAPSSGLRCAKAHSFLQGFPSHCRCSRDLHAGILGFCLCSQSIFGNKKFVEPPLEKEILIFLASLGHSRDIRKITDVNVNKLHQPWRSFAAIINNCLSGIPSYDSLRLSQAQILW
ncbi:hypothetical protein Tco_1490051, partial [Tanacetum coccineum]